MRNKYINITVSIIVLCLIALLTFKYFGKKTYTSDEMVKVIMDDAYNSAVARKNYEDTINFIRGQLSLQENRATAQLDRVTDLEKQIDVLTAKHANAWGDIINDSNITFIHNVNEDTGFVLAPNEYVKDCEGCFDILGKYKKENIQLRFERDGYDSLLRQQSAIQENRIGELNWDGTRLRMLLANTTTAKCDTTRKVKLSIMGMFGNPFLPKGGGAGLIYEDKKFNEYGGHFLLTNDGPVYMLHIAKTITFKRKK